MSDQDQNQPTTPNQPASQPTNQPSTATTGLTLGSGLDLGSDAGTTTPVAEPAAEPVVRQADPPKHGWWWGTGRRKTAVARVRIKPGAGEVKIQTGANSFKTIDEYFTEERDRQDAVAALKATNTYGKMDVVARLGGGGYMGQAGALLLGISRALLSYDPNTLETLRENGYLTRDPREVERKKYGQAGARRRFQFSKR
jgi:small subunit ribosomal protein S9